MPVPGPRSDTARCTSGKRFAARAALAALLIGGLLPTASAAAIYGIDSSASWLRVLVYRGGMLGRLGHNHVISLQQMRGCIQASTPLQQSRLVIWIAVQDLQVDAAEQRCEAGEDFPGTVAADDIAGTRRNMLGPALLDAERFPEIRVQAAGLQGELPSLLANAIVNLRDSNWPLAVPLDVSINDERIEASGERELSHKELGLRPFRAMLGALRVADTLHLQFHIRAGILREPQALSDCERALAVVDNDRVPVLDPATE